jgi:hypothetical protein
MDGVMDNIGGAMTMASTGLVVMGAAVPLRMLQGMQSTATTTKRKKKGKKKSKKNGKR